MSLRDLSPQVLWVQVLFQSVRLSSPTAVSVLNVLIEEVIFGDVLGINRTLDDKFAPHCSPVDDFNQIYEVLFGFEASYEFSVIRRPAAKREVTVVRAFQCEACRVSSKVASFSLLVWEALRMCPGHGLLPRHKDAAPISRAVSRSHQGRVWERHCLSTSHVTITQSSPRTGVARACPSIHPSPLSSHQ